MLIKIAPGHHIDPARVACINVASANEIKIQFFRGEWLVVTWKAGTSAEVFADSIAEAINEALDPDDDDDFEASEQ